MSRSDSCIYASVGQHISGGETHKKLAGAVSSFNGSTGSVEGNEAEEQLG